MSAAVMVMSVPVMIKHVRSRCPVRTERARTPRRRFRDWRQPRDRLVCFASLARRPGAFGHSDRSRVHRAPSRSDPVRSARGRPGQRQHTGSLSDPAAAQAARGGSALTIGTARGIGHRLSRNASSAVSPRAPCGPALARGADHCCSADDGPDRGVHHEDRPLARPPVRTSPRPSAAPARQAYRRSVVAPLPVCARPGPLSHRAPARTVPAPPPSPVHRGRRSAWGDRGAVGAINAGFDRPNGVCGYARVACRRPGHIRCPRLGCVPRRRVLGVVRHTQPVGRMARPGVAWPVSPCPSGGRSVPSPAARAA